MSNSMALVKRPADTDLMPPPPIKRMKRPPKVLPEEDYNADLDYIIARDYFPGLLEADAQQDYLNALEAGDEDWMEEAGQRVKAVMTPREERRRGVRMTPRRTGLEELGDGRTPKGWRGATPLRTPARTGLAGSTDGEVTKKEEAEPTRTNMSLSSYQATYTSEDNTSFANVVDKQNAKRREKYRWLWTSGNKLPSKQQLAQQQITDQQEHIKALEAPEYFSARYTGASSTSTALIRVEGANPSLNPDDRPAMIDKRPPNPRNGLFFNPDDTAATHPYLASQAETDAERSKAGPKGVSHANTRIALNAEGFAVTEEEENERPPSPTISAIDAAMKGRPHPAMQKGGSYADSDVGDQDGSATPMVEGWKFVDADVPVETPPDTTKKVKRKKALDHDALLTSLIETHNDDDEGGTNPFRIDDKCKRESLHHGLVEKQNASKRAKNDRLAALKGQEIGQTPRFMSSPRFGAMPKGAETPSGVKKGVGNLTPAARALYARIGGQTPVGKKVDATPFGGRMAGVTPVGVKR